MYIYCVCEAHMHVKHAILGVWGHAIPENFGPSEIESESIFDYLLS